jgi:hypothetical protein
MKKTIMICAVAALVIAADYDRIPVLKWAGPAGSRPGTYEEWVAAHPYTEFSWIKDGEFNGDGRQGTVAILTQQSIAGALANEISQLSGNLQSEGYTVLTYQISGGTPESLRVFLQNQYNSNNIEGALFIGTLPVAWFEVASDHGGGYADFPIDLYYMDMNGTWLDTLNTGNGKFDGHTGDLNPEIYIGRLMPTGMGVDTVLIKNYFRKNNAYRHDTLELQHRALVFCDDDWIPWAAGWANDIATLYPDTMNYWHAETTRASIYRVKLDTVQAWVSVFAHSSPSLHQFAYNGGGSHDYYYSNEYFTQDPPTNFYNHFACSFSRYTENGYGGGRSIFNQSYGIGEVGSTKTGSMLDFNYFYQPLSTGKTMGEAFEDWFTHITYNGVTLDELCWHYGMTCLGDPWLLPVGHDYAVAERPDVFPERSLLQIFGSPSVSAVRIVLAPEKPSAVNLTAFDCTGRKIRTLMARRHVSSWTEIVWRFIDDSGNALPAGIYIIQAEIDDKTTTRKVIKL